MNKLPIILASASSERAKMLENILIFKVIPADIDETPMVNENAQSLVERLAIQKAKSIQCNGEHIISADTIIEYKGEKFGKPADRKDAKNTIQKLMGKEFNVWTSTAIILINGNHHFKTEAATLTLNHMSEQELEKYLDSNIWVDKAGSFSINDQNCPATIIKGDLDSVRGISLSFINDTLSKL